MADWLVATGIKTVAMESTGVYWVPVYEVLEGRGIEVILANAREARTVPGRKSDVNDAQWLQRLHACGLLRASFRPGRDIAALRVYLRLRERHLDYAASHIQHMPGLGQHQGSLSVLLQRGGDMIQDLMILLKGQTFLLRIG